MNTAGLFIKSGQAGMNQNFLVLLYNMNCKYHLLIFYIYYKLHQSTLCLAQLHTTAQNIMWYCGLMFQELMTCTRY